MELTFFRPDTLDKLAEGIKNSYEEMLLIVLSNWLFAVDPMEDTTKNRSEHWLTLFRSLEKKLYKDQD